MDVIADGFQIDWTVMRDHENDITLWTSNQDLSSREEEHKVYLPSSVCQCKTVSREICFSTKEAIANLKLEQTVMFKKHCLEKWLFEFGPVEALTTNVWKILHKAAPEIQIMPSAKVLSGNVVIESKFMDGSEVFCESKVRIFYRDM